MNPVLPKTDIPPLLPNPTEPQRNLYVFFSSMFVTLLVLTNMIGTKLFILFPGIEELSVVLTSGIITYPFTFWLTDIVSETYGKRKADLMVIYGFVGSMLMLLVLQIVQYLPPAESWKIPAEYAPQFAKELQIIGKDGSIKGATSTAAQTAFTFTFDAPGLLLFASMLAYMVAQLSDNYLFHFWRRLTRGKHLWLRNNGSTAISQLLDTIIVNSIFLTFYWKMPFFVPDEENPVTVVQVIVSTYLVKLAMALADTPLIYAGIAFIKKAFGISPTGSAEP
ncbi:MAG: queuosine precursor transporter [Leptospiraceae bacterium]|nr:queuosine precursor transporter [Leptospiraceae bacterium]